MNVKSCCFVCPDWIRGSGVTVALAGVYREIDQAIVDGYTHFIVDGGWTLNRAIYLHLLELYRLGGITLELVACYESQLKWSDEKFQQLVTACTAISAHNPSRQKHGLENRNMAVIGRCERLIAVDDGKVNTIHCRCARRAEELGKEVRRITAQ